MIKLGCNFLSLRDTTVEQFIRICYDLRLDVVDFHQQAFQSTDPAYLTPIKLLCLRYGLPIGYIGVSGLFHGTAEQRRRHAADSKRAVDLAAFLGSPLIRMFCATVPAHNGDGNDTWPPMIAGYREVADYAAARGVAIGLQNHPSTADEMLRIRRDVDRDNCNFIMDTGQWLGSPGSEPRGETDPRHDFYGYMAQTIGHASYIRTKFYRIESGTEEWLDYERIVALIKTANYNGCISIVYEGEHQDRVEQIRLAAAYLRDRAWRASDRPGGPMHSLTRCRAAWQIRAMPATVIDQAHVEAYRNDGYLMLPGMFDDAALQPVHAAVDAEVDRLADRFYRAGKVSSRFADEPSNRRLVLLCEEARESVRIWELRTRAAVTPELYQLVRHPALLDLLTALLGPEVAWTGSFAVRVKLPESVRKPRFPGIRTPSITATRPSTCT